MGLLKYFVFLALLAVTSSEDSGVRFKISAGSLPDTDHYSRPDPYAEVYLNGVMIGKTYILNNNRNPNWPNEFTVGHHSTGIMAVKIYDMDAISRNDLIATVEFPVLEISTRGQHKFQMINKEQQIGTLIVNTIDC